MNAARSARALFLSASLLVVIGHADWWGGLTATAVQTRNGTATRLADAPAAARHVDRAQLMRDLSTLASPALEGRRAGTAGGAKARAWIAEQFASISLMPAAGGDFVQPFSLTTRDVRAILPGGRPYRTDFPAANVVGRIAGHDPGASTILVTAHYDHLGVQNGIVYPGADDNASGVAALLAAARYFATSRPRHSMLFAALDAEEPGQHGARALLRTGLVSRASTALNVNLDMVSRSDANEIYAAGPYYSPWQTPILQDVQTRASVTILVGHDRPPRLGGGREDWTHSSDHGVFHDAGVPFVYFGVEDHPDYHQPTDTADRIEPRFFGDAVDMVIEAIRAFDAHLNQPRARP
jgi:hypothetical protein